MAKKKKEIKEIRKKSTNDTEKKSKKKKTTSIEVCSEEWLRDYFKEGSKTDMTFALVEGTEYMQLIHIDPKERGHTKEDGTFVKGKTKFEAMPIEDAITHLRKFKLVVIRQVGGKKHNFFKIIGLKTAKNKGLLKE